MIDRAPPPDALAYAIRFVVGFVVAGGLTFLLCLGGVFGSDVPRIGALSAAVGVVFGLVALKFGDRAFEALAALFRWW
jgi:hypothetical protein